MLEDQLFSFNISYCVHTILCCPGEGPSYTMRCDHIQQQAMQCNKKKKSAKIVEVHMYANTAN